MKQFFFVSLLLIFSASCSQKPISQNTVLSKDNTAVTQSGILIQSGSITNTKVKVQGYTTYTSDIADAALKSWQKVVLFFAASWCPTCQALNSTLISDLSTIPADTLILRVNYDNSTALRQKYGVVVQHTTVVLNSDGTLKFKKLGARSVAEIFN